jgi:hypothetical protein
MGASLMYTLYLDGSGDPGWCSPYGTSNTTWYVLGGAAINDSANVAINMGVADIIKKYSQIAESPIKELKYSALIAGNKDYGYDRLTRPQRKDMANEVFDLILEYEPALFATAIHKNRHYEKYSNPFDPLLLSFRFTVTRYDKYLVENMDKGKIFMDSEAPSATKALKALIEDAKISGIFLNGVSGQYEAGPNSKLPSLLNNLDFNTSENSPGIQLADFCSHAVWRKYERAQGDRFSTIQYLYNSSTGISRLKQWPY